MPFHPKRLTRLRELKGLTQAELAAKVNVTQTHVSNIEAGRTKEPSLSLVEAFADHLDCTTEFLLHRSFKDVDSDEDRFRGAVSSMAFDVFSERLGQKDRDSALRVERCRRVKSHRAAPVTAEQWAILAEHIALAIGAPPTNDLQVFQGGR